MKAACVSLNANPSDDSEPASVAAVDTDVFKGGPWNETDGEKSVSLSDELSLPPLLKNS